MMFPALVPAGRGVRKSNVSCFSFGVFCTNTHVHVESAGPESSFNTVLFTGKYLVRRKKHIKKDRLCCL